MLVNCFEKIIYILFKFQVVTQITEIADQDQSVLTEGGTSVDSTNKITDLKGFESRSKKISDLAKAEFEKNRQELAKDPRTKDSMMSG